MKRSEMVDYGYDYDYEETIRQGDAYDWDYQEDNQSFDD